MTVLERHGMKAYYAADKAWVLRIAFDLIPEGAPVGRGESTTLGEVGLISALREGECDCIDPYSEEFEHVGLAELLESEEKILVCDIFLTGANAVTLDGGLVNVDAGSN